jgi:hypothetical protein
MPVSFDSRDSQNQKALAPVVVVSTILHAPAALARWIEVNLACAGLSDYILFLDGPGDPKVLESFLTEQCPSVQVCVEPSTKSHELETSARQRGNLALAREMIPKDAWIVSIDSDEVIWIPARLRKGQSHPLRSILSKYDGAGDVRFWPYEFALKEGESFDAIPSQGTIKYGVPHSWPKPFAFRILQILTLWKSPLIEGGLFLANDFAKSACRSNVSRDLHHHGFVSWAPDAESHPLEEVWAEGAFLIHFDFLSIQRVEEKVDRVRRQLEAGLPRSKNRIAFVQGYLRAQGNGGKALRRYVRRYVHLNSWVRWVMKWLHVTEEVHLSAVAEVQETGFVLRFNPNCLRSVRFAESVKANLRPTCNWMFEPDQAEVHWHLCRFGNPIQGSELVEHFALQMKWKSFLTMVINRQTRKCLKRGLLSN